MKKNKRVKRKVVKNKKKFLIAISALLGIVCLAFVFIKMLKNPTDTFLIENGEICLEETVEGYIIRDEIVLKGENYGSNLIQIKNEGEKVAKGETIFRYSSAEEESLKEEIRKLDLEIEELLDKEDTIFSTDIKLLDTEIEKQIDEIYESNNLQLIAECKKEINSAITKKAQISGELSKSGSYIKELINKRAQYENQLNNGSEKITAVESGFVSYKVDGLEEILTTENFDYLSTNFLDDLNLKIGQIVASSNTQGKIINEFKCYIACELTSEKAKEATVGTKVTIKLPNAKEIPAKINYIKQENDEAVLAVLEIENEISELIKYRKINIDVIWWNKSGLKVPNSAINYEGNLTYLIRNKAGYEEKVYVKVVKQNDTYSIIKNYSNEELEELGYDFNNLSGKKSVTLYDEIKILQ